MAYDEKLAGRVREALSDTAYTEKKMFGGIAYMVQGNMAVGINEDNLMVRVGPDAYGNALAQPHVRPFDLTGRSMKGWVLVEAGGISTKDALDGWVADGVVFARSLPPK